MSKIGTIKVEAIINPTNAELDLVDGVGERRPLHPQLVLHVGLVGQPLADLID